MSSSIVPMTTTVAWKRGLNLTPLDFRSFWLWLIILYARKVPSNDQHAMHIQAQKFAQLLSQHLTLCFFAFSLPLCLETCNIDRHVDTGFSGDSANSRKVLVLFFFGYGSCPPFASLPHLWWTTGSYALNDARRCSRKAANRLSPFSWHLAKTSLLRQNCSYMWEPNGGSLSPILQGANLITHGLGRGMDGPIVILGNVNSTLGQWWKSAERISVWHVLQNPVWVHHQH